MADLYNKFYNWLIQRKNPLAWLLTGHCVLCAFALIYQTWWAFLIALLAILFVMYALIFAPHNKKCRELSSQIDDACEELECLFDDSEKFVEPMAILTWRKRWNSLINQIDAALASVYALSIWNWSLQSKIQYFQSLSGQFKSNYSKHNNTLANKLVPFVSETIGYVEGRQLDEQQKMCIAKDVHNSLVIAGAGTGKTTTVIGKIKYLLATNKYRPEDFLVLSFTNASASEMSERITKETGESIEVSTFHKLGLNIITEVEGVKPKIADIGMYRFVKDAILENMRKPSYAALMTSYLLFHHVGEKSEWNFKTEHEYKEYLRFNPPCTIKQEVVKSCGEVDIANFLYMNNIEYIYEKPYPVDTRTYEYGEYKPDFYLPEYGIYIEYFGVAADGSVPAYFTGKNGMSAKETYHQSMQWKRKLHTQNNTNLIECYAWEHFDDILIDELKRKLKAAGVNLKPQSPENIWDEMTKENAAILDGVIQLFETVINLMKSNRYTTDDVKQLAKNHRHFKDINVILKLIEPIAQKYDKILMNSGSIDFNDMINKATDYVTSGKYQNPYKYVIVDEYQDIAKSRFMLLKALRKSKFYDLFCVGDDWQSIYRFAGSDISFILEFEKYWGPAETSKIETTYRFSQELSELSGQFVMKNPAQVKKRIKGIESEEIMVIEEICGTNRNNMVEQLYTALHTIPRNNTVYFIGRYNSDIKMFEQDPKIDYHFNNAENNVAVTFKERRDLKITFISAHKSKGLQADYVFIINNKNSKMGFPSRIQDAPILDLLLGTTDSYPFAEERRLFYVALTRARKKVFLCTMRRQESMFVFDVLKHKLCPRCGGRMFKKNGPYGKFWGCENYIINNCSHKERVK